MLHVERKRVSRREFLKALGIVAATPVLAKIIPSCIAAEAPKVIAPTEVCIGQYADYMSFSDIAMETSTDPALMNLQSEMAYRFALTVKSLYDLAPLAEAA